MILKISKKVLEFILIVFPTGKGVSGRVVKDAIRGVYKDAVVGVYKTLNSTSKEDPIFCTRMVFIRA